MAYLAWGAIYPLGIRKSKRRTGRRRAQRTTVFIHGYLGNPASFFPLSAYLKSIDDTAVLSFRYSSRIGVEQAARQLKEFLKKRVRGGRIDLVCHSLGGVIARMYLQELGGARKVDRCITLGTPHQGTYSSYWLSSRIGHEMRPDSPIMRRLAASRAEASRVKFTSIVGGTDNIVVPRVFATHDESQVHIPDIGHVGLLFSPKVFFEVARCLAREGDGA